jgi:hypothetical protein
VGPDGVGSVHLLVPVRGRRDGCLGRGHRPALRRGEVRQPGLSRGARADRCSTRIRGNRLL